MLKQHRLSSHMNDIANTVPVSLDTETDTVVADTVPVAVKVVQQQVSFI